MKMNESITKFDDINPGNVIVQQVNALIPRGRRADFLRTTITISAEMLTELRALGMTRRAAKQKDTDTSALIREALTDFLRKNHE